MHKWPRQGSWLRTAAGNSSNNKSAPQNRCKSLTVTSSTLIAAPHTPLPLWSATVLMGRLAKNRQLNGANCQSHGAVTSMLAANRRCTWTIDPLDSRPHATIHQDTAMAPSSLHSHPTRRTAKHGLLTKKWLQERCSIGKNCLHH